MVEGSSESELDSSSSELSSEFVKRLRVVIGSISVLAFAKKVGVSDALMRKYLAGSQPGIDNLVKIATAAGVSVDWLLGIRAEFDPDAPTVRPQIAGPNDAHLEPLPDGRFRYVPAKTTVLTTDGKPPIAEARQSTDDIVHVMLYRNVLSAGEGEMVLDDEVIGTRSFNRAWIEGELGAKAGDLAMSVVRGDSMEPTLHDGDIVLIDRRDTGPLRDDIYALLIDGDSFIKRLQKTLDGGIDVISDNARYKTQELQLNGMNQREVKIYGRVVWWGHTNGG